MSQFVVHLVHIAAWAFGVIFLLALIGVIAIVRWIVNLFRKGEAAVESGARTVEGAFRK